MKKYFAFIVALTFLALIELSGCAANDIPPEISNDNSVSQEASSHELAEQEQSNVESQEQEPGDLSTAKQEMEETNTMQQTIKGSFAINNILSGKNLRPDPSSNSVEVFVSDGNGIVLYPYEAWKCMTWTFTHVEGNTYKLQNLYTEKTFQPSGELQAGVTISQQTLREDSLQYWDFIEQSDGVYLIRPKDSELYLTITSSETNSPVVLMPKQNSSEQEWKLIAHNPDELLM